ncbi:unnamed protein product [Closterium sp. Naga37s-1]|nr:unnamed protein product [Closterium sp. Naga37s-1]
MFSKCPLLTALCAEEVQGVKVHASVLDSGTDWHCSPSCAKVAAELKGMEGKRGEIPDGTPFSIELAPYNESDRGDSHKGQGACRGASGWEEEEWGSLEGARQSIAAALKVWLPCPPSAAPPSLLSPYLLFHTLPLFVSHNLALVVFRVPSAVSL